MANKNKQHKAIFESSKGSSEKLTNVLNKTNVEKPKLIMPKNKFVLIFKMLIVAVFVIGFVRWTDSKRWFQTRESNAQYKSDCVDKLLDDRKMDIVFAGNSHAQTIDPFVISQLFKCNVCVYSEDGILSDGLYYLIENLLDQQQPKLLCVETFPFLFEIFSTNRNVTKARVLDRMKSETRKLRYLSEDFNFEKSPLLYSRSLRNHEILFDSVLLNQGIAREKNNGIDSVSSFTDEKYLFAKYGALVYYATLSDSLMAVIDSVGPLIDGKTFKYEDNVFFNVARIAKLCEERNVPVLFYSTPIYYKVFKNYEDIHFKFDSICNELNVKWVDYQLDYDTVLFEKNAFFDKDYVVGMHLNRYAMKPFSYMLSNYIHDSLNVSFPDRSSSKKWKNEFLGKFDYQFILNVLPNDTINKIVFKNIEKNGVVVNEMFYNRKEKNDVIYAKVKKENIDSLLKASFNESINLYDGNFKQQMNLTLKCTINGRETIGILPLNLVYDIRPIDNYIFCATVIKDLEYKDILKIELK